MTEAHLLTLRDLIFLNDRLIIPDDVVDRIERGDIFGFGFCWCGRDRDEHPNPVFEIGPGVEHEVAHSGTRSLHRLLGLGQAPLPHSADDHDETFGDNCVRCRMDRYWAEQVRTRGMPGPLT